MSKKVIVLLSGGQDSTTCLFWAKKNFDEVVAVGFNYGQKHAVELNQAITIANIAKVPFEILDVRGLLGGSSLTEHSDTNEPHKINPSLPSSFTAGRNMLFLTVAAQYAYNNGIRDIVTGVCQTDFSGYPDCRRNFINSMEVSLGLAMDTDFRIHTPLMYLTKAETWKLANDVSDYKKESWETIPIEENSEFHNVVRIVRDLTMTDYNGNNQVMNDWGMGLEDNPASELRARGYREARELGYI